MEANSIMKTKKFMFAVSIILITSFVCCGFMMSCQQNNSKLSESQISELRAEYPLIKDSMIAFDFPNLPLETMIELLPIIAEIELIEVLPDYTVEITAEIDGKIVSNDILFHQYKINVSEVVRNTIGTELNDTIVICFADHFKDSFPVLKDGVKYIVTLEEAGGPHEGKYLYSSNIAYYITDDNYILSVYEEHGNVRHSGMTKDNFLKTISEYAKAVK